MAERRAFDFRQMGTVELGDRWQLATETDRIAFASADRIELVGPDRRTELTIDDGIDDIALDRYVATLSGEKVETYTDSGVSLWSQTVPGATQLVAVGPRDLFVVVGGETIVGLDAETGRQLFECNRAHPEFDDVLVGSGTGFFCLASWSFLASFDTSGELLVDENLDSSIEDIGVVDGQVVVSLKGGQLVALDAKTGKQTWRAASEIRNLGVRGNDWLPALTPEESIAVTADGRIEPLTVPPGDRIVASGDQTVIAVADNNRFQIYGQGDGTPESIKAKLLTDRLEPGIPVRVAVEHIGSEPSTAAVALETTPPLDSDPASHTVSLDPGDSREIAYRLDGTPSDQLDYRVLVDGTERASGELAVVDDPSPELSVTTTLDAVSGAEATYRCRVTNEGKASVESLRIGASESETSLGPGESTASTLPCPLGTSRNYSVVASGRSGTTIDRTVTAPKGALEVTASRGDRTIDLDLTPAVSVPLSGELTVSIGERESTREISLDDGDRLRYVLVPDTETARSETIEIVVDSPLLDAPRTFTVEGWTDASRARSNTRETTASTFAVTRTVPEVVDRGTVFTEQFTIENEEGRVDDLTLSDRFETTRVGTIEGGETRVFERSHVTFANEGLELPQVDIGDETVPMETITVREPPIETRGTIHRLDESTSRFRVTVRNNTPERCELLGIGVDTGEDERVWTAEMPIDLGPSETETIERAVELHDTTEVDSRPVRLLYRVGKSDPEQCATRAPVAEPPALSVSLTERSQIVADTQGVVEIELENHGERAISDMTIAIDGEIVTETLISPDTKQVSRLDPGEQTTVRADIEPTRETGRFVVALEGAIGEREIDRQFSFVGPVAQSGEQWRTASYRQDWKQTVSSPDHLVTTLRPTGAGNPR